MERAKQLSNHRHVRRVGRASKHPLAVPFFTIAGLLLISAIGYMVFVDRNAPERNTRVVIVNDNGEERIVPSEQATVGNLVHKLGIKVDPGDRVEPALDTPINQDDFRINVYRAVPVQVIDGGKTVYTFSAATTPRAIARQTGSDLYAEDRVITEPTREFLRQGAIGEQVIIDRATPVSVNLYGTPEVIRTHADTVGELIKEKGIKLESNDQLSPAADTPLSSDQQVFIAREGTKLESVEEQIAMPVQVITDTNLAYGTTAIRQQGAAGKRTVTYQVNLRNGQPVGRSIVSNIVTQEPVTQIEVRGSSISGIKGDMGRAGISPSDYTYVDFIVSKESGWNPNARNKSSGAYGLCQALPGTKMASAGSDWSTNPVTQLRWCDGYAKGRYGTWAAAYNFWKRNHWW